ncbi:MAG: PadR family transcriptional regulator [Anaerolineales bacterium]|nr:PadR family transcriptional regulator [Anaerolineales bacterium]
MCSMVRRPPGIELALLGFLLQGPQHGYQLHQIISDLSGLGLIWRLKQSQLYALLNKLETDGFVISTIKNQDPHPPRRIFELTESGRRIFFAWLADPVTAPRLVRQDFFAKLYFAARENKDTARRLIELQRIVCQSWIDRFNEKLAVSEQASYSWTMYQYRLGQVKALQSWLDAYEKTLST